MKQENVVNEFPNTFSVGAKLLFVAILIASFGPFAEVHGQSEAVSETQETPEAETQETPEALPTLGQSTTAPERSTTAEEQPTTAEEQPTAAEEQPATAEELERFYLEVGAASIDQKFDSDDTISYDALQVTLGVNVFESARKVLNLGLEATFLTGKGEETLNVVDDVTGRPLGLTLDASLPYGIFGGIRAEVAGGRVSTYFRTGYSLYRFKNTLKDSSTSITNSRNESGLYLGLGLSGRPTKKFPVVTSIGYTISPGIGDAKMHLFYFSFLFRFNSLSHLRSL